MKSPVAKRSIVIHGHKTSISLEDQFWSAMKAIATERQLTLSELVSTIDHDRGEVGNLSSALRCFVLARYYAPAVTMASQPQTQAPPVRQAEAAAPTP